MSIVFGTDFSEHATVAALAAAALAHRTGEALHLVHVLEYGSAGSSASILEAMKREATTRLEQQAAELRKRGADPKTHLLDGAPDEVIVELASSADAYGEAWNYSGPGAINSLDFITRIYRAAGRARGARPRPR